MDVFEAYAELQKGNRLTSSLIAPGYWIEMRKGKIKVANKRGLSTDFKFDFVKVLNSKWEIVSDEKITKVEVVKVVTYKAECPSCLTWNELTEEQAQNKRDVVIECSKCGSDFGLKGDNDKDEPVDVLKTNE
jgi:hypothetical protein